MKSFFNTSIKVLNSVYTEGLAEEVSKLEKFLIDNFELEQSAETTIWLKNQWFQGVDYIKVYFKVVRKYYQLNSAPLCSDADVPKELQKSEIDENEKWKYDEYTDLEFEVVWYLRTDSNNQKYKTLELLKESEIADVYTIGKETDEPKRLLLTPDNKLRYFGNKADYGKQYIIVLPKDRKRVGELYKKQDANEWESLDWLSANEPECEDPFDERRIQAYIDLVDALYVHVRVLSAEEKKQLWHEFNKQNLKFYHYWNEIWQGREEGPDMEESYGFRHYFFCQEHNVSWQQLPQKENDAAAEAIMDCFEKHRNLLDILSKR